MGRDALHAGEDFCDGDRHGVELCDEEEGCAGVERRKMENMEKLRFFWKNPSVSLRSTASLIRDARAQRGKTTYAVWQLS